MVEHHEVNDTGIFVVKTEVSSDHVTKVTISATDDPALWASGYAKLNPGDIYEYETGQGIATGRALAKFGRKLARRWEGFSETPEQRRSRLKQESALLAQVDAMKELAKLQKNMELKEGKKYRQSLRERENIPAKVGS